MSGLSKLNMMDFTTLIPVRESKIEAAKAQKLPENDAYKANQIAKALHPDVQNLIVSDVVELNADARLYTLTPDLENGTKELAYFSAGQYLSISLQIGSAVTARPYSICSAPSESLNGVYKILVKKAKDGFVSDYIISNWEKGTKVKASAPEGNFTFEPLRDAKNVIGIAGGSGISVFYSMAKAIQNGDEDFSLTILYGSRTEKDILLRKQLDEIAEQCSKVKIVYVLSDEDSAVYEHGFITADLIQKYKTDDSYSVFVCGPKEMYDFEKNELKMLGLRHKFIRFELSGLYKDPHKYVSFPKEKAGSYSLKVCTSEGERTVNCSSNETLLVALERSGIEVPSRCRSGECGWCRLRLVKGEVFIPDENDGRRLADIQFGYIHPCVSYPLSNIALELNH